MTINVKPKPKSPRPDVSPIARLNKMNDKCPGNHQDILDWLYSQSEDSVAAEIGLLQRQIAQLEELLATEKNISESKSQMLEYANERLDAWREWHKSVWGRDATEDYLRKGNKLYKKLRDLGEI